MNCCLSILDGTAEGYGQVQKRLKRIEGYFLFYLLAARELI